jgi:hypothetical protein
VEYCQDRGKQENTSNTQATESNLCLLQQQKAQEKRKKVMKALAANKKVKNGIGTKGQ